MPKKISKQEQELQDKKEELRKLNQVVSETEDVDTIVDISRHEDDGLRFKAVKQLCPCKVRQDIPEFWTRMFEMVEDRCPKIRMQILHNLCDGSPPHLESQIKAALEKFNQDEDPEIRRRAHKVLYSFNRDGIWNVL